MAVLLRQDRKPYSQEEVAMGIRKRGSLGQELSGYREDLSYLTEKWPLEAENKYEEDSICAVIKTNKSCMTLRSYVSPDQKVWIGREEVV